MASPPTYIYTLSLHDALPIPEAFYRVAGYHLCGPRAVRIDMLERLSDLIRPLVAWRSDPANPRSEEHTSELQSLRHLVCRLLLEKKKKNKYKNTSIIKSHNTH